ncbi:MAG TPA: indole-3-glycerol phosphate synthase TrpC [Bryobacteraceae bacterium]|jgi:indole-3-glycerol phosphate synthase|nr:indole-3-glycerol phosphate synthase TrpC [Bryobacteraceae bacterium]
MTLRATTGILSEIVAHKHSEIKGLAPLAASLERRAHETCGQRRPFAEALRSTPTAIIAEIKKASPSKGLLQPDFHPGTIARDYEQGGAACLSVLTDGRYFQGSLNDLQTARSATALPALRKDFTIDRLQIFEAAAHGADAVLLIAAILNTEQLRSFRELATELGLAALIEIHNESELERAIDSGAGIIGVNNRNLDTFEVSLDTSLRLGEKMPDDVLRVSESGIFTKADIELLKGAGFRAFLIGESLMKSADSVAALRSLTQAS